jgi:hypothetical protein
MPMLAQDIIDLKNGLQTNIDDLGRATILPVGTILMYDGTGWVDNSTLPGWYKCAGQTVTINGQSKTMIDLTNKFIRGGAAGGGTGGSNTGSTSITLTSAQLPVHAHSLSSVLTTSDASQGHTHSVTAAGTVSTGGTHNHSITDPGHDHTYNTIKWDTDGGDVPVNSDDDDARTISGTTSKVSSNITVKSGEGSHDHSFSGTQVTSGGVSQTHSHTVTLTGNTGNVGSAASIPISLEVVPVYYTVIYIKKMA